MVYNNDINKEDNQVVYDQVDQAGEDRGSSSNRMNDTESAKDIETPGTELGKQVNDPSATKAVDKDNNRLNSRTPKNNKGGTEALSISDNNKENIDVKKSEDFHNSRVDIPPFQGSVNNTYKVITYLIKELGANFRSYDLQQKHHGNYYPKCIIKRGDNRCLLAFQMENGRLKVIRIGSDKNDLKDYKNIFDVIDHLKEILLHK